jgi:excisionase family DNA binding protein
MKRDDSRTEGDPATRLYSVREVADRMSVSERWLRSELAAGRLPTIRLGSRRLISEADLAVYVQERRHSSLTGPEQSIRWEELTS